MSPGKEFDEYVGEYTDSIDQSIGFSGCDHAFFTLLKAEWIARILHQKLTVAAPRVLDVGCGIGAIHPALKARSAAIELTGVDVSQASIDLARQRNQVSRFLHYDGSHLPFEDDSFDAAFAICVLHHVPPAARPDFVAEIRRVVRPGGVAMIIEHNPLNPLTRHVVNTCEMDRDAILLGAAEGRNLLAQAGFADIATHYIAFLPIDSAVARRFERLLAWLPLGAQYISCGRGA